MAKWAGLDLDLEGQSSNKYFKNFRFEHLSGTDRPKGNVTYNASFHSGYVYYDADNHWLTYGRGGDSQFHFIADMDSSQILSNKTLKSVVIDSINTATDDAIIDDLSTVASPTNILASIAGIKSWVSSQAYEHPTGFSDSPSTALADLSVISQVTVTDEGHVNGVVTRELPASTIQDGQGITWTHDTTNNILTADANLSPFSTDDLVEGGSNLYFTNERVDDRVAMLLSGGTNISLTYSDSTNTLTIAADTAGINYWTKDGSNNLSYIDGDVSIGEDGNPSDLYVWGNIYQNGDTYNVDAEHIRTSDEFMVLRYDASTAIAAGDISGLQVTKYDGTNDLLFGTGNDGFFRIGESGSLQLIATRDDNADIVDGNLLKLDEATNKLVDAGISSSQVPAGVYRTVSTATTHGTISQTDHGFAVGSKLEVQFWFDNGSTHEPFIGVEVDIDNSTGDISWTSNPNFQGYITIQRMAKSI